MDYVLDKKVNVMGIYTIQKKPIRNFFFSCEFVFLTKKVFFKNFVKPLILFTKFLKKIRENF